MADGSPETTWPQVCEWFEVDPNAFDLNMQDTLTLIFKGAEQHADDPEDSDWRWGVEFAAAADVPGFTIHNGSAPAHYGDVQRALLRVAASVNALMCISQDTYEKDYGEVRKVDRAYTELGAALEAVKQTLAT
jgi:hypothetical protein